MTTFRITFYILFFCFIINVIHSQTPIIDSLIRSANTSKIDTIKVKLYSDIAWELLPVDISRAEQFAQKEIDLATGIKDIVFLAQAESDMGNILNRKGDFDKALIHYYKAADLRQKLKQPIKVAGVYSNIATVLSRQNKFKEAIDVNFKSLKIFDDAHDRTKQAIILGNIGNIYYELNQKSQAAVYFRRGLSLARGSGDPNIEANSLVNLGELKFDYKELDSALYYFHAAEKIFIKNNLLYNLGATYNNIGKILSEKEDYDAAIEYYQKGLENRVQFEDEYGIALSYLNLGDLYVKLNNFSKAIYCLKKCEITFKENKNYISLKDCYLDMATAAELKGEFNTSAKYYKLWGQYKDSVYTKESADQLLEVDAKYQTEKKEQENKLLNIQNKLSEKTIKQQRTFSYFIGTALFLLASLAFFIFRGLRQQKKANLIISEQKRDVQLKSDIINEKHKEITDSINYAERIQRSFLATREFLDTNLSDYFVFFQPKDVVSGDFYWASKLKNGHFALVTADSTGHGVPGAIMSILNISCLEKSVEEEGLIQPGEILDHTRINIIKRLKKDGSKDGGKDGMDASLMCFDFKNNELTYAAANNPIWIVREDQIIELAPDKMPVGKHERDAVPFTQHTFILQKKDVVYSLTDGMPDQFGGPKGKKFMYKKLKELLVSIAHLPMNEQKEALKNSLNDWKGDLEQVDDVCIIGVRL